ncbi:hypothetical protein QL285_089107 [Trifolium repens]|nr:hypothetical protein QL285_089107 [Trifolium repens]
MVAVSYMSGCSFWRGRRPQSVAPSSFVSRQIFYLNYMGWKVGLSCYWAYAIHFWAVVQSTAPQARGSKRRSGDGDRTWGNNRSLLRLSCIITSINNHVCSVDFHSSLR